jgi:hypothetical protein
LRYIKENVMAKLTTKARKAIPTKEFALPGRRYPIEDALHARAALSRVSANGTPAEKAKVRAKVHAKYPEMGKDSDSQAKAMEQHMYGKSKKKF